MQSPVFCVLLLLIIGLRGFHCVNVGLHPERISVVDGEGFIIRVNYVENQSLQSCELSRNGQRYFFPPGQDKSYILNSKETVHTFDRNNTLLCGIRVFNANDKSRGSWTLTAISSTGSEMTGSVQVGIKNIPTESCLKDLNNCQQEDLILPRICYSEKCVYWSTGKITQSSLSLSDEKKSPVVETKKPWETVSGSTILECDLDHPDTNREIRCLVEHLPSGKMYSIRDGLQDIRYSAYDTRLEDGNCQFEIPQEITAAENGLWRMKIEVAEGDRYYETRQFDLKKSCLFYISRNITQEKEDIERRTNSIVVQKTFRNSVTIECTKNSPYPITVCYLVLPTGLQFSDTIENGSCAFTVTPGRYTCGFNGFNLEDEDYMQEFEVIKYDTEIIDEKLTVSGNNATSLECHYIEMSPIRVCALVSPSGVVYRPPTDDFKSDRYTFYTGGKMSTGDCGIEFGPDVEVEKGLWKCIIVKMNGEQLSTLINYVDEPIGPASIDDYWL